MSIAFFPFRASSLNSSRVDHKKRIKKSDGPDFSYIDSADEPSLTSLSSTDPLFSAAALPALMADQSSASLDEKKLVDKGNLLLDHLETLRLSLLSGSISASRLSLIQELLSQQRETCQDSRLLDLMEEINVRAAVELAKLKCFEYS